MSVLSRQAAAWWIATVAVALALLAGCGGPAQTSVTQLWKAPVATAPMKRVMVVAAHMNDEASRRALEDSYVAALAQHGVSASASYTVFPGEPPSREKARAAVKDAGFDGILVSTMRSVKERQTSVPGWYEDASFGGWAYGNPGYTVTDEVVSFDTTVWDPRVEDRLVFALTTETTNPSAGGAFIESLTRAVISAVKKQRLLPL